MKKVLISEKILDFHDLPIFGQIIRFTYFMMNFAFCPVLGKFHFLPSFGQITHFTHLRANFAFCPVLGKLHLLSKLNIFVSTPKYTEGQNRAFSPSTIR